jgi:pimeloyl-CoA synthetase
MKILELHQNGVMDYLHKKGLLSSSTLTYIEYYKRFLQERNAGNGYRESIRRLTREFGVSETTIKKAVRIMQKGEKDTVQIMDGFKKLAENRNEFSTQ